MFDFAWCSKTGNKKFNSQRLAFCQFQATRLLKPLMRKICSRALVSWIWLQSGLRQPVKKEVSDGFLLKSLAMAPWNPYLTAKKVFEYTLNAATEIYCRRCSERIECIPNVVPCGEGGGIGWPKLVGFWVSSVRPARGFVLGGKKKIHGEWKNGMQEIWNPHYW